MEVIPSSGPDRREQVQSISALPLYQRAANLLLPSRVPATKVMVMGEEDMAVASLDHEQQRPDAIDLAASINVVVHGELPGENGGHIHGGFGRRDDFISHDVKDSKLFSFGAIADVQYADCEDGWNWNCTVPRYFRGALDQLRKAANLWLEQESHSFVLQLGDLIDGRNAPDGSEAALSTIKGELQRLMDVLPLGVLNSLGNHELYNFPKERWAQELDCSSGAKAVKLCPSGDSLSLPWGDGEHSVFPPIEQGSAGGAAGEAGAGVADPDARPRFYYSFCPCSAYRFIALDTFDVNAIRERPVEHEVEGSSGGDDGGLRDPVFRSASMMLDKRNPNREKNSSHQMEGLDQRRFGEMRDGTIPILPPSSLADSIAAGQVQVHGFSTWDVDETMIANPPEQYQLTMASLFVQYNGGLGPEQLRWLEDQLAEASRAGQRVVAFGHIPIHPGATDERALMWNYDVVLAVIHKFDCMALYMSGHQHQNGYHRDAQGVHYITLAAALETPAPQEAFASVDVYEDRLELRGHGVITSRTMLLPSRIGRLVMG